MNLIILLRIEILFLMVFSNRAKMISNVKTFKRTKLFMAKLLLINDFFLPIASYQIWKKISDRLDQIR